MTPEEQKRTEIIDRALNAVISISVSQEVDDLTKSKPGMIFPVLEKDQGRVKILAKNAQGSKIDFGGGSGFVVHPSGIIITNIHVIYEDSLKYTLTFRDGSSYLGTLLGTDRVHDLAYLKISSQDDFPFISLGDSSNLKIGQSVFVIGNVLGLFPNSVTTGIISGLGRSVHAQNETLHEQLHNLIQTDAAINPGDSGGPLLDSDGNAVGINSANVAHAENIGFAIPINSIKNDLNDILTHGKIRKGYLGVRHVIIDSHIKETFNLPVDHGVYVVRSTSSNAAILPKSPAENSGLQEHDIILQIDGKELNAQYTLEDFLQDAQGGQKVLLTLLRKGNQMVVEVILGEAS